MATKQWIGGAPVVPFSNTFTVGGTFVAGSDTISIAIDGVTLTLTIGSGASVVNSDIAAAFVIAWNSGTLGTGYSVNFYGTTSPKHYELVASAVGAVITLTERALPTLEGKTFPSITASKSSAAGTFTAGSPVTPTGPHHFDNAANWSTNVVPANTDELIFSGGYDCRYMIDQSATPLTTITVRVRGSYAGRQLGLPRIRTVALPAGDATFEEYRDTYLKTNTGGTVTLYVGEGDGAGPALVKINTQTSHLVCRCWKTDTPAVDGEPALYIVGGGASSSLTAWGGAIGLRFYEDDPSTTMPAIYLSRNAAGDAAPVLVAGPNMSTLSSLRLAGATVTTYGLMPAGTNWSIHDGGVVNYRGPGLASNAAFYVYGGTLNLDANLGGTIDKLYIGSGQAGVAGVVNIAGGQLNMTIDNLRLLAPGATFNVSGLNNITFTNNILVAAGLSLSDIVINMPLQQIAYKVEFAAMAA